jgi:hypothetical protein
MRCSKCGSDNREGRKFCTNCGTPLVATCPKCGAAIEPEEKFCGECGAAIGASVLPAPSSAQPSPLQLSDAILATEVIDGERKTVTALFADIKGSMELMEDRRQGAKSWELRATTSLARLLRDTGRRDEERVMLAELYGWFTEGFNTVDLKQAKALLDQLQT